VSRLRTLSIPAEARLGKTHGPPPHTNCESLPLRAQAHGCYFCRCLQWDRLIAALGAFELVESTESHHRRALQVQRLLAQRSQRGRKNRPQLTELLATVEKGDTVVVCRLDRLGRSLPNLLNLVEDLTAHSVGPAVARSVIATAASRDYRPY